MKFLVFVASVIAVAVAAGREGPGGVVPVLPVGFEPIYDWAGNIIPEGIAVGPTFVENDVVPIAVGPALVPFPLPDGGEVVEEPVVAPVPLPIPVVEEPVVDPYPVPPGEELVVDPLPSPVVVPAPVPAASAPLVQIILNINQASSPVSVGPAVVPAPAPIKPEPVHVVEAAPEPVQVVEVAPEPVQVVEVAPVQVEPVQIGVPIIPHPAVVLPEELN